MFVDRVQIEVAGGRGGDGCLSFRREKYVPRGGPDGGDGGNGGSVIIVAEEGVNNLAPIAHRKHWHAKPGGNGQGSDRHGKNADDVIVHVPPGTVVIDAEGGYVMKDLAASGDQVVAAHGGRGGKGNTHFKSSTNRAPRQFTPGSEAESRRLILELKVIADVGLIGKPNAGKSTLLARLSRARPEIADYPFTTKHPNLGRVEVNIDRGFIMADIPGLIEGAHEGVGLGHDFLRHIERTRFLVFVIDIAGVDGRKPHEDYLSLRNELKAYKAELNELSYLVVANKTDMPEAEENLRIFEKETGEKPLLTCAELREGTAEVLQAIYDKLLVKTE